MNSALLYEIADRIEANPKCHEQRGWVNECGTSFCIAGHAMLLRGYRVVDAKPGINHGNFVKEGDEDWCIADPHRTAEMLLDMPHAEANHNPRRGGAK